MLTILKIIRNTHRHPVNQALHSMGAPFYGVGLVIILGHVAGMQTNLAAGERNVAYSDSNVCVRPQNRRKPQIDGAGITLQTSSGGSIVIKKKGCSLSFRKASPSPAHLVLV